MCRDGTDMLKKCEECMRDEKRCMCVCEFDGRIRWDRLGRWCDTLSECLMERVTLIAEASQKLLGYKTEWEMFKMTYK